MFRFLEEVRVIMFLIKGWEFRERKKKIVLMEVLELVLRGSILEEEIGMYFVRKE